MLFCVFRWPGFHFINFFLKKINNTNTNNDNNAFICIEKVLWWDMRRLGEPIDRLSLQSATSHELCSGICLAYHPEAGVWFYFFHFFGGESRLLGLLN